ncbi:BTB/POZ domain-containing protein 3-like isoform X2 [Ruditapes philippinarum]|nr:BTB/POZ domain-containing protein 3-like isoform X2 [Ruditapes philippinarum]
MENSKEQPQLQNANWRQGKTVGACMGEMFDRGLWTDVEFQCKDHSKKGIIKAHKIVLAARSPVFEAMFFGPCADGKSVVEVKNIESDIFQALLRYIYSDTVNLTEEIVFSLMETAHCYQVSCLVQYCADFLCTILSPTNACDILTHAILYELVSLRDICCSFIDNNVAVLKSNGFLDLSEAALLYILKGDTFYVKEEDIIEAADKWSRKKLDERGLEQNGANIRKIMGQAFYQLRIPTLTNKSLVESVSRKGYLSVEEYSDISAFINNVDGIRVATNSCIVRIPERESIISHITHGIKEISDQISIVFEICVKKDVLLRTFTLYTLRPSHSYCPNGSVFMQSKSDDGNLPANMNLTLSVCVQIKTLKLKKVFEIQQQQQNEDSIHFDQPLVLKESKAPYLVEMTLSYKCGNGIQVQTTGACKNPTYDNTDGTITIKSYRRKRLFGIKRIDFQNFSNR